MKLIFILISLIQLIIHNLSQGSTTEISPHKLLWHAQPVKLTGVIQRFDYKSPMRDPLDNNEKSQVMVTERVFNNSGNMVIEHEVKSRQEFDDTFELTFTSSTQKFLEKFTRVTTKKSIGFAWIFMASVEETEEESTKVTTVVTNSKTVKFTNRTSTVYEQKDTVKIPPHQRVRVQTYLETVKNRKIPFVAYINVTGTRSELSVGFWLGFDYLIDSDLIKHKLREMNFNGKIVKEEKNSVLYTIDGYIVASYALKFILNSENLGPDQSADQRQTDDSFFDANYLWPIVIIVAIIAYLIKYIIKSKRRLPEPQNTDNAIPLAVIDN